MKPGTDGVVHTNSIEVTVSFILSLFTTVAIDVILMSTVALMSYCRVVGAVSSGSCRPVGGTSWSLICLCT